MATVENISIRVTSSGADKAARHISSLTTALEGLERTTSNMNGISDLGAIGNAITALAWNRVSASVFSGLARGIENLSAALKTLTTDDIVNLTQLSNALSRLNGVNLSGLGGARNVSGAAKSLKQTASGVRDVGNAARESTKHTSAFASSILRIMKYRLIRTLLKNITQGFTEGLKNAYHFSKQLNGSLANALDNLATKSNTMKNQMGAAFGALLQAIMPVILTIINLITQLMQALAALFAAIGGGQYLVAKDTAAAWDKAAGGAQKYKNTVLGFDELNKLDDPNSGGGGGSSGLFDYEDAELPKWAQWIKEHLDLIKDVALAIGAAIAGWKIANVISDLTGANLGFKKLLGIAMAVAGAFLLVKGAMDAIANGVNWTNLIEMLSGTALLAGGLALAFGKVGGAIGLLVGGVTLLVAGFKDWITTGELSTESFLAIEGGILAVGAGIALLTGSWIPLLIAAVAGLVFAIVTHWEEIKKWTKETWNKIKTWTKETWENLKKWTKETWENLKTNISNKCEEIRNNISEKWGKIKTFFSETVPKIVEDVRNWFSELPGKIGYIMGQAYAKFENWNDKLNTFLREEVPKIVEKVSNWFGELPGKIKEKFDLVMQKFNEWKTEASNWVNEKIPEVVNSVEAFFAELPSKLFNIGSNLLSSLWDGIKSAWTWVSQKIEGIGTSITGAFNNFSSGFTAGYTSIRGYASGGFPETGELFVSRESGPELVGTINGSTAVANNDDIVAAVAMGVANAVSAVMGNRSNDNTSIHVYLDSREIKAGQSRLARATGV